MKDTTQKIKKRYNRIAPLYDILEYMMEKGQFSNWRKNLWQRVSNFLPEGGKVLEAGVGTGKNIPYYPKDVEIYAIDFSKKMLEIALKKARANKVNIKFFQMDIQDLDFVDNYFDIIVSTCVFCSVPDPVKGFKELKRVCKPDGKIILLEHMRTEMEPWGRLMDIFNWVSLYTWGANINRRTIENIKKAGLNIVESHDLWFDIVKEIVLSP